MIESGGRSRRRGDTGRIEVGDALFVAKNGGRRFPGVDDADLTVDGDDADLFVDGGDEKSTIDAGRRIEVFDGAPFVERSKRSNGDAGSEVSYIAGGRIFDWNDFEEGCSRRRSAFDEDSEGRLRVAVDSTASSA